MHMASQNFHAAQHQFGRNVINKWLFQLVETEREDALALHYELRFFKGFAVLKPAQ